MEQQHNVTTEQNQNRKRPEGYTTPEETRSLLSGVLTETRAKGLSREEEIDAIMKVLFDHKTSRDESRLKSSNAYEVR